MKKSPFFRIRPLSAIILGYLLIILLGATLLSLPAAAKSSSSTPFFDTLFTSTSATCVTGLIVFDTYTHWSSFGQGVILALIQVGGLGFMTLAIAVTTMTRVKIGLKQRFTVQEAIAAPQVGGVVRMTRFILLGTLLCEAIGALLLSIRMIPLLGAGEGIWFSVFHSVSAFCNAGFDLMGKFAAFSSLTRFVGDGLVNLVLVTLIVVGGLGFYVWMDVGKNRLRVSKYRLHTKLVLSTTAILLVGGTLLLLLFDWESPALASLSGGEKILACLFSSATPRTAGFNTVDFSLLSEAGIILLIGLMLIGGSPGSTAGGAKTTTAALLALTIHAEIRRKKNVECFGRRIEADALRRACCLLVMYLLLLVISAMALCALDGVSMKEALFETASALGTVGLSLGLTPTLSMGSQAILMILMFFGRVGGLTILYAFAEAYPQIPSQLPPESVTIG